VIKSCSSDKTVVVINMISVGLLLAMFRYSHYQWWVWLKSGDS